MKMTPMQPLKILPNNLSGLTCESFDEKISFRIKEAKMLQPSNFDAEMRKSQIQWKSAGAITCLRDLYIIVLLSAFFCAIVSEVRILQTQINSRPCI